MVNLDLEVKRSILAAKNDGLSNVKNGVEHDVSKSTIGRVLKEWKDGLLDDAGPTPKKVEPEVAAPEPEAPEPEGEMSGELIVEENSQIVLPAHHHMLAVIYAQETQTQFAAGDRVVVVSDNFAERDSNEVLYDDYTRRTNVFTLTEEMIEGEGEINWLDTPFLAEIPDELFDKDVYAVKESLLPAIINACESIKFHGCPSIAIARHLTEGTTRADCAKELDVSTSSVGRAIKKMTAGVAAWFRTTPIAEITKDAVMAVTGGDAARPDKAVDEIGDMMKNNAPYKFILDAEVIMIVRNGSPNTINLDHPNFEMIRTALEEQRWDDAVDLIDVKKAIESFSCGRVAIEDGQLTLDGEVTDGRLASRILTMLADGNQDGVERLSKFLEKMDSNPSNQIVMRIYDFLKFNDIEIDADGDILAYKVVDPQYKDLYTHKMDNSVGQTVSVKRHQVDENMNQTCSYGLHVCAIGYVSSYSGNAGKDRVVRVKMNPADVVAIPRDYGNAKVRCCKYVVIEDVTDAYLKGAIRHVTPDSGGIY